MNLIFGAIALFGGVLLTTQVGINTMLGKTLHNPYMPAAVSMLVGMLLTFALVAIVPKPLPTESAALSAPWWLWIAGGALGALYLTGNILLAPKLGAGVLVACVVTGQLSFAVAADHFGWLGFEQHSATIWRGLGCVLMIGGLALIAKF
jgi:transporter family-2 protein